MTVCDYYLQPPGFRKGVQLSAQFYESSLALSKINDSQAAIVKAMLLLKGLGSLEVTAPTWEPAPGISRYCIEDHHLYDPAVDFGGPPGVVMTAFLNFLASTNAYAIGLGLNGSGYTAQTHLHVGVGTPSDRWIETNLTANTYKGRAGYMLTQVRPGDVFIAQQFFNDDPKASVVIKRQVVKGLWKQTLDDAKRIYGVSDADPADVQALNHGAKDSGSSTNWPLILAVLGAAYGYEEDKYAKMLLFAAGGFAAGRAIQGVGSLGRLNPFGA